MNKRIPAFFAVLCLLFALCAPGAAQCAEYIDKNTAVVRIMNKAAGKTQVATVPVGRAAEFEKLDIMVRACKETPPYEMKDFFMFVEISKKTANNQQIFSGWMTANEPGDNPLQDADYDLWLVRCE